MVKLTQAALLMQALLVTGTLGIDAFDASFSYSFSVGTPAQPTPGLFPTHLVTEAPKSAPPTVAPSVISAENFVSSTTTSPTDSPTSWAAEDIPSRSHSYVLSFSYSFNEEHSNPSPTVSPDSNHDGGPTPSDVSGNIEESGSSGNKSFSFESLFQGENKAAAVATVGAIGVVLIVTAGFLAVRRKNARSGGHSSQSPRISLPWETQEGRGIELTDRP